LITTLNYPEQSLNQHNSIKQSRGFIILQRIWILQNIEHHLVKQNVLFVVTVKQPIVSAKQPIVFPLEPMYNVVKFAYA